MNGANWLAAGRSTLPWSLKLNVGACSAAASAGVAVVVRDKMRKLNAMVQ